MARKKELTKEEHAAISVLCSRVSMVNMLSLLVDLQSAARRAG